MGANVSAPIAKNILEDSIEALDIDKPSQGLEKEYRYFDTKYYTLEDVVGMDIKDAKEKLSNFTLEYSGKGTKIVSMSPEAGSRIAEGSIVRLMLST